MRETRTYGSVRGARGDARPYRDQSPCRHTLRWGLLRCARNDSRFTRAPWAITHTQHRTQTSPDSTKDQDPYSQVMPLRQISTHSAELQDWHQRQLRSIGGATRALQAMLGLDEVPRCMQLAVLNRALAGAQA